jgi:hypothetical protein
MARRAFAEATTINDEGTQIVQAALNNETAVVEFQASGSELYSGTMAGIHTVIEQAAAEVVAQQIADAGGPENFSAINVISMTAVEAFRQVSGLDLTAVLLRAYYLRMIQEQNLLVNHPAQYRNLSQMAAGNGCAVSDMLATLDMVNIMFPYVQNQLGIPVHDLWATLGKSKIKELLPVLKALITGQPSDTESVRLTIERFMDEQYAGFRADPALTDTIALLDDEDAPDEDRQQVRDRLDGTARHNVIEHLIELGDLPVMELRRHIRPTRTTPVPFYVAPDGTGGYLLTSQIDQDQMNMMRNKMGERGEWRDIEVAQDQRSRMAETLRNPLLRRVYQLLGGIS